MERLVNYGEDVLIKVVIECDVRRDIFRATTAARMGRRFRVGKIARYMEE